MIKVLKSGLYTSIQDTGRVGFRNLGVPLSGAMDSISAGFANALLNNKKNDAVLEITMLGPKLEFFKTTQIAISGAEISPKINNISILNNKVYTINSGDVLSFGKLIKGVRAYLAVKGGFKTEIVLKSRSFYDGITSKDIFKENDFINIDKWNPNKINTTGGLLKNKIQFFETSIIEVYKGPELELFDKKQQELLLVSNFTIGNTSNRMGYRLEEIVLKHSKSMITSPVLPGTVQLTPEGKLIVLMKDAQTTGGYPRVFQLTEKSIAILAQKATRSIFNFKLISI